MRPPPIPTIVAGLACALLLTLASGCVGAWGDVHARNTRIPVSFTSALPGQAGEPLVVGRELVPVGRFAVLRNTYGFIYSATPMDLDISGDVEAQVRAVRGEGIANLDIGLAHCPLNFFFPFNHLPIWAGCGRYRIEGDIVRRRDR